MLDQQGKFFKNIYFTIVIISCIGISLSSIVIGIITTANVKKITMNYSGQHVERMADSMLVIAETGKSLAIEVYQDKDIIPLLYGNDATNNEIIRALNRMHNYLNSNPGIKSIYVFNRSTGYIYSTLAEGRNKRENFFDTEINKFLQGQKEWEKLVPIPRTLSDGSQVYTFIYHEGINIETGIYDNIVVVNLNQKMLDSLFSERGKESLEEVFVLSAEGKLLSSWKEKKLYSDLSNIDYIRDILDNKEDKDSQIITEDGQQYFLQYKKIEELGGWIFVDMIPYFSLKKPIISINLWCMGVVVLGSFFINFLSYWISGKIYHPIKILEKNYKELNELYRKNEFAMKNAELQKIFFGNGNVGRKQIGEIIEKYYLNLLIESNTRLLCFFLKEEDVKKHNEIEIELLDFIICNICDEIGNAWNPSVSVVVKGYRVVMIMNEEQNYSDEFLREKVGAEIQKKLFEVCGIKCRVIIGEKVEDMSMLSTSFQNMEICEKYFILMNQPIITQSDIIERQEKFVNYPSAKVDAYLSYFTAGKQLEANRLCKELLEEASQYTYNYFNYMINHMIYAIGDILGHNRKGEDIVNINQKNLFQKIQQADNVNDILREFQLINHIMAEFVREKDMEKKKKKNNALIEKVDIMIKNNYSDINLNIQYIAGKLQVSPAYLGRIYNNGTGKTLTDAITQERLNAACALLKKDVGIQEIVECCGFCNVNYFYRLFKKVYGTTPSVYRTNNISEFIGDKSNDCKK